MAPSTQTNAHRRAPQLSLLVLIMSVSLLCGAFALLRFATLWRFEPRAIFCAVLGTSLAGCALGLPAGYITRVAGSRVYGSITGVVLGLACGVFLGLNIVILAVAGLM